MDLDNFRILARNWEAFGETDPFFGVLSDPTKHGGQWSVDEFFESGRAHVQKLMHILADRGVTVGGGSCLDFGCGVGRLTVPLSHYFEHTIGVDVAGSMIEVAQRHNSAPHHCQFVLNREPDLRQFEPARFDMVHSCLVLQHIPPDVAMNYVAEFFRVTKPGGFVVFQLPAEHFPEDLLSARYALPESAFRAHIELVDVPASLRPGAAATVRVNVTNNSPVEWSHDIPAGRHLCIANHWLHADGTVAVADDGRARLPMTLRSGQRSAVDLVVRAPSRPGSYVLEVDVVQERICWFAEKGSTTARSTVAVAGEPVARTVAAVAARAKAAGPRRSLIRRLMRPRPTSGTPTFEMYVVPQEEVRRAIHAGGGELLHAIEDGAAGDRWLSYTYVCRTPA